MNSNPVMKHFSLIVTDAFLSFLSTARTFLLPFREWL